jgi:hypothetical protein
MASTTTQAVAARVPNRVADLLRQQAERSSLTMSDVVRTCICQALDGYLDTTQGNAPATEITT